MYSIGTDQTTLAYTNMCFKGTKRLVNTEDDILVLCLSVPGLYEFL